MHQSEQKLVVEGIIENGKPPYIILTRSQDYFSAINIDLLKKIFVHHAEITVSAKGRQITLVEKEKDTSMGAKFYYYAPKGSNNFKGIPGTTYQLSINDNGKIFEAETTIPSHGFKLDSLWWEPATKNGKPDSSKAFLIARIYDPVERGNYARYFTKRNSEPFYPGLVSVAEDEITNGKVFNFQLDRGVSKNTKVDREDFGYFAPGDTVILKFCNIDKDTYDFWKSWEYSWSNNSNPFATPTTVKGNIPGALGYWGGYQAQYRSIIIPK